MFILRRARFREAGPTDPAMFVFSVVSEDDLGEANFDSQINRVLINLH